MHLVGHSPAPQAFGGPDEYKGKNMYEAHKALALNDGHFNAVAGHFVSTLTEMGVDPQVISEATFVVASTRGQVRPLNSHAAFQPLGIHNDLGDLHVDEETMLDVSCLPCDLVLWISFVIVALLSRSCAWLW